MVSLLLTARLLGEDDSDCAGFRRKKVNKVVGEKIGHLSTKGVMAGESIVEVPYPDSEFRIEHFAHAQNARALTR